MWEPFLRNGQLRSPPYRGWVGLGPMEMGVGGGESEEGMGVGQRVKGNREYFRN